MAQSHEYLWVQYPRGDRRGPNRASVFIHGTSLSQVSLTSVMGALSLNSKEEQWDAQTFLRLYTTPPS